MSKEKAPTPEQAELERLRQENAALQETLQKNEEALKNATAATGKAIPPGMEAAVEERRAGGLPLEDAIEAEKQQRAHDEKVRLREEEALLGREREKKAKADAEAKARLKLTPAPAAETRPTSPARRT